MIHYVSILFSSSVAFIIHCLMSVLHSMEGRSHNKIQFMCLNGTRQNKSLTHLDMRCAKYSAFGTTLNRSMYFHIAINNMHFRNEYFCIE